MAGNINEMMNYVRRYYPIEAIMLELLIDAPEDFSSLANENPLELQHLLSLGLVVKDGHEYQAATVLGLL